MYTAKWGISLPTLKKIYALKIHHEVRFSSELKIINWNLISIIINFRVVRVYQKMGLYDVHLKLVITIEIDIFRMLLQHIQFQYFCINVTIICTNFQFLLHIQTIFHFRDWYSIRFSKSELWKLVCILLI